jgi:hypothetical protein
VPSVADARQVGLLRRLQRLAERVHAALGQQRDQLQEHLGGDHRVAERGVST